MKENVGITLIALVVSIVVMLILAGVSLNATVGDNGILSKAKDAKRIQGMAVLEEYLQEKYVENYDNLVNYDSKLDGMINIGNTKKIFQKSSSNNYYFLSPNTYKEYYFIEKSALPEDIQKAIVGGDNSLTGKTIYAEFEDIYGINSDLEVFYCSNGYDSWTGAEDTANITDMSRPVFSSVDNWASILGIEGNVTLSDIRSVQDLTLSNNNVDLSKLGSFASLKTLTINTNFDNLNGIEEAPNLTTIYIKSSANVKDYSAVGKIKNLTNLYFVYSNDNELQKFCESCKDFDMIKLQNLCISTEDSRYYFNTSNESIGDGNITSIEPLSKLSSATKASIKYLCISGNKISSLAPLRGFTSLYFLNARKNNITSLNGLQDSKNLTYLCMNSNNLGMNLDVDSGINISVDGLSFLAQVSGTSYNDYSYTPVFSNLNYLNISSNPDVVWIDYVKSYSNLKYLYLKGCSKLSVDSVTNMKSKLKSLSYSIDNKYTMIMADENSTVLNLASQKIDKTTFLGLKEYTGVVELNLTDASIYDGERKITGDELNTTVNTLLSQMPNLKYLSLNGFTDLSDFSFLKNLKELIVLDVRSTNASTLNSQTGLELLNNILTLKQLAVSGANIDLTKLQPTINRLGGGYSTTFTNGQPSALMCTNWTSLSTLENCTELTKIDLRVRGFGSCGYANKVLDLSKLTLATTYYDMYVYNLTIILPPNITNVDTGVHSSVYLNAKYCEKIDSIYTHGSVETLGILETAKSLNSIKSLYIRATEDSKWAVENMDKIAKCTNLEYLRLGDVNWNDINYRVQINSLGNLENLKNLKKLTKLEIYKMKVNDNDYSSIGKIKSLTNINIKLCNVSDISWIGDLEDLTTLTINDCQLNKGIKALSNLSKLSYLNLQNNTLYDMSIYENQPYNTCEVLASMNKNKGGSLESLYLSGNPNITDFTFVKECNWTSKSGF